MFNVAPKPKVLYLCSRLPGVVQSGLDLRIQGQILSFLTFCDVSVLGLNGREDAFDERIQSWQSPNDPVVAKPIDAETGAKAVSRGGNPFASRYSLRTASKLLKEISVFQPDYLVVSRIDLSVYLDDISKVFSGNLILDLDESVASTGPSIQKVMAHPGQALVFKAFAKRVQEVEQETFGRVDQIWVSSEVERERTIASCPSISSKVFTVPNSIPVNRYSDAGSSLRDHESLIYPASFAYEPSLDAARLLIDELMPILPELTLKFVGTHIPDWMSQNAQKNISVEGPVADIVPYLHAAGALVVPLRAGGGTRLKVIEALASGLPIVSTSFGVEGLGLRAGRDYLEAEYPSQFATKIRELLSNPELYKSLSSRGIKTAEENFSIESLARLLFKLLASNSQMELN